MPGIPEAMRALSLQITPRAMLSRAAAGIRKGALIMNLPGSPKAVGECLEYILPPLSHGLSILKGTTAQLRPLNHRPRDGSTSSPRTYGARYGLGPMGWSGNGTAYHLCKGV